MAHSAVMNGGSKHARGVLSGEEAFYHRRNLIAQMTQAQADSKKLPVGNRIGPKRLGVVRCPACCEVSHDKYGEGPHECDHADCRAKFMIAD